MGSVWPPFCSDCSSRSFSWAYFSSTIWLFTRIFWLLIGAVIGGAVHDTVVLFASMTKGGKSLSEVCKEELGPVAGFCTGLAMLFIITITMAGLSMVIFGALEKIHGGHLR